MRKSKIESLKTRQHLLNAALEVFYRQGVTRCTLNEIAQEAGVTRGALYWHFKNKEDLFEALFQRTFETFFADLNDDTIPPTDALGYLRNKLLSILQAIAQDELHQKFCSVLNLKCENTPHNEKINELSNKYSNMFISKIECTLQLCYKQGRLPQNIDLDLATLYVESTFVGLMRLWINQPERFDLMGVAENIIDASMNNLQNSPFLLKNTAS